MAVSLRSAPSTRLRRAALLVHRYVGLVMSSFLLVAGTSGALLAFQGELDAALNPRLLRAVPPHAGATPLDPFTLQARVNEQLPQPPSSLGDVVFDAPAGETSTTWLELEHDKWRQVFVDPYTGKILGSRDWGNLSEGFVKNLMPFIYRLHYSLALDDVGTLLFGLVALLWTLDCFVGAYLTFPPAAARDATRRGWFKRWLPAWRLRTNKLFSFVFTWHRASGLWVWAMLLVFAWSAVGLNLPQVYAPIMRAVAGFEEHAHDRLPHLEKPYPVPALSLRDAYAQGQRLMQVEAARRGFTVKREVRLSHHADHGAFSFQVESSLDISSRSARTEVYFDQSSGRLLGFDAPTGISAGNTITAWLYGLHFAAVGGLWYRVIVSLMGVAVAALSISGVWIWLRKRVKRAAREAVVEPRVIDEVAIGGQ